jgi:Fe-S cluster assembly protein SufD
MPQIAKVTKITRDFSDRSTGVFNGFRRKSRSKKQMRFKSNNILLSDKATINAKPQLEIFADDVNVRMVAPLDATETAMFTCNNANSQKRSHKHY